MLAAAISSACAAPEKRVRLDVPAAEAPTSATRVGEEVAKLLSPDVATSDAAARVLEGLDEDGRKALAAHAKTIPNEPDPRWLTALEFNGLLTGLAPSARVRLLCWQSAQRDARRVWRAQSGLLDLARSHPDALLAALADPACLSRDAVAVALADAGERRAIPALVEIYRSPTNLAEGRAASLALGRLAGSERRPRDDATDADRARDADRLLTWYRTTGGTREGP